MRALFVLPLLASVVACTVGPDYAGPPKVASAAAERGRFVRAEDQSVTPAPGIARWWETLGDPTLTTLVDEALAGSPTIDAAQGRVREAQARIDQGRANLLPNFSLAPSYIHATLPGVGIGNSSDSGSGSGDGSGSSTDTLNFYNLAANASWEPDIFGGKRRSLEAARATLQQRYADLADAQVSLSAQVAQTYVNLRDAQARVRLNARSTALQSQALELTRQRFAAGTASRLDVERLESEVRSTDAQNIPLTAQVAMYKDALAVLTGRTPGELDATLDVPEGSVPAIPLPPASVPIGDPAALIAHRPDVRAAERALAASTANIGAKRAQMFPSVKFTGMLGTGGTSIGDVVDSSSLFTLLTPQLNWSFLDFGRNRAALHEAQAQRDTAEAQYRQSVLEALQDAEDSLARFGATRRQLAGLAGAERSANIAATLSRQRFAAGTGTLIDQLDVERRQLSASSAVIQSTAALTVDYIAIQKALGLGWSEPQKAQPAQ